MAPRFSFWTFWPEYPVILLISFLLSSGALFSSSILEGLNSVGGSELARKFCNFRLPAKMQKFTQRQLLSTSTLKNLGEKLYKNKD